MPRRCHEREGCNVNIIHRLGVQRPVSSRDPWGITGDRGAFSCVEGREFIPADLSTIAVTRKRIRAQSTLDYCVN